jgi:hypothetical protein
MKSPDGKHVDSFGGREQSAIPRIGGDGSNDGFLPPPKIESAVLGGR